MSEDALMTVREACAFFGGGKPIAETTLRNWVRLGLVPKPIRVGRQLSRWRRSALEAALKTMEEKKSHG